MPEDDVVLSPEATDVVHRIEQVDAELADIEQSTEAVVGWGMKGGFTLGAPQRAEARLDSGRDELVAERARLVERLKALTGVR